MIWITMILLIICCFSLLQVYRYQVEADHMEQQLRVIREGSSIMVTSNTRSPAFLRLCNTINDVLTVSRQKEVKYKQSERELQTAISSIAHDIRTPLTSAAGYMQMLEDCSEEKRQRYQKIILMRIEELKNMLEELFLYTKLSSNDFEIVCESISVFTVLSECMVSLYPLFEEHKTEPVILFEDENLCIHSNKQCLERIFRNILGNALLHGTGEIKITQSGKTMRFSNSVAEGHTLDTERIFDRFYKEDAARRKGSSGLGLAIVKELILKMGGSITAECSQHTLSIHIFFQ